MPVEIRELQITTTVQDKANRPSGGAKPVVNTDEIIAKCVEQLLEILKEKAGR